MRGLAQAALLACEAQFPFLGPPRPSYYRLKLIRKQRAISAALIPPDYFVGQRVLVKYYDQVTKRGGWMPWEITAIDARGRIKTQCLTDWHDPLDSRLMAIPPGIKVYTFAGKMNVIDVAYREFL